MPYNLIFVHETIIRDQTLAEVAQELNDTLIEGIVAYEVEKHAEKPGEDPRVVYAERWMHDKYFLSVGAGHPAAPGLEDLTEED